MTDQDPQRPFAPPYQLNTSSVKLNGEDTWLMATPEPPKRPPGRRRWVLPVVILSVVVLVGGLVAAGAAEFQAIAHRAYQFDHGSNIGVPDAPPGSDHIPTQSPTEASVTCPPTCFTAAHAGLMIPDGSLLISLGGNFLLDSTSLQVPAPASQLYQADAAQWASQRHLPDACFLTSSTSPVSALPPATAEHGSVDLPLEPRVVGCQPRDLRTKRGDLLLQLGDGGRGLLVLLCI